MGKYYVDIGAGFTIQQLSNQVKGEEASELSWYRGNEILTNNSGAVVNHWEFEDDDERPMPSVTSFVIAGTAGPAGLKKFWTGPMLVQNAVQQVDGYR